MPFVIALFFPFKLPCIVALDALYSLTEAVSIPVLVIRMAALMLMKNNTCHIPRNFGGMKVPVMSCIPTLDGHVVIIHRDNIEILRIYRL